MAGGALVVTPALLMRVPGTPAAQGSVRSLPNGGVTYSEAVYKWRHKVTAAAQASYTSEPLTGPVGLTLTFELERPQGHYGTGANSSLLRLRAPALPQVRPDLDKLVRCVSDALTDARVWLDDAQVAECWARKVYASRYQGPGVSVAVYSLPVPGMVPMPEPLEPPASAQLVPEPTQLQLPGMEHV